VSGSQQNVHPTWHFNDQVWNQQQWMQEPEVDILELYRMRARQIRDNYQYVIINFSGGSDSQSLVDAFLQAGCFIDEIVTIWNREHTPRVIIDSSYTDSRNIEAEFDLTTKQALDRIKLASPSTKITYLDISGAVVKSYENFDGEEWLTTTAEHLHPQYVTRWSSTREKHQLITLDRGLKTAVVFGVDKPKVCIKDGKYCVYFVDIVANSFRGGFDRVEYSNLESVFFYWTPDLPEIVVKQAHMIMRWFEANSALKSILHWPNLDYQKRSAYEIIVKSIIYPTWDLNTFQCAKTTSPVYSEWDAWFFHHYKNTKIYECWHKGIEYVQSNVDQKYLKYNFDNQFDGFIGMINEHFYLN
jgi:hypothetical protein